MRTVDVHRDRPPVVVGVDGSPASVSAALWAAAVANRHGARLHLTHVMDSAEEIDTAVRRVSAAVAAVGGDRLSAVGRPASAIIDIQRGAPTERLIDASRTASLICIGAVGAEHSQGQRIGAHVVTLAAAARCPVAVIRGDHDADSATRWVVADLSGDDYRATVVTQGVMQARLRGAPLRILSSWQPRFTDIQDPRARAAGNRRTRAEMEHRLEWLRDTHPDIDIAMVAESGSTANYLRRNADSIGLLIVARRTGGALEDRIDSPIHDILLHADCSILVCPVPLDDTSAAQRRAAGKGAAR